MQRVSGAAAIEDHTRTGWAKGFSEAEQRQWLLECYQMRVDDDYFVGGGTMRGAINYAAVCTDAAWLSVAVVLFGAARVEHLLAAVLVRRQSVLAGRCRCSIYPVRYWPTPHGVHSVTALHTAHGTLQGGDAEDLLDDFLAFCKLTAAAKALPPGWAWPPFLRLASANIHFNFEKSDAQDKYGSENFFAPAFGGRSLRATAGAIYGGSSSEFDACETFDAALRAVEQVRDRAVFAAVADSAQRAARMIEQARRPAAPTTTMAATRCRCGVRRTRRSSPISGAARSGAGLRWTCTARSMTSTASTSRRGAATRSEHLLCVSL